MKNIKFAQQTTSLISKRGAVTSVIHWQRSCTTINTKENMTQTDFVFFWGHTGRFDKDCFSQWFMRDFEVEGQWYCCMEQYMMAQKAVLFGDHEVLAQILSSIKPAKIKKLGREVKGFDSTIWDKHKYEIVIRGNIAKFSQNADLKAILLDTGNKILVEASPYDKIWGIGLPASDPRAIDPKQWLGQNLLGKALMQVRETLRVS